jgi:hypothetical protein
LTGKGQPLAGNPRAPSGPSLPLATHENQGVKKKVKFFVPWRLPLFGYFVRFLRGFR